MGIHDQDLAVKEHARFEGVWRCALVEVDGAKQPQAPFKTNKLLISKDGSYVIVQGPQVTRGIIKLDPAKKPKHYDVTVILNGVKGQPLPGIYEMEGDILKISLPLRGKVRPTDFVSKPWNGLLLFVYHREKQDLSEALIEAARQELAGTWQAVSYALDGKKASDEEMKKVQLVFDRAGKTTALNEGKVFLASTTKIDPAKNPMAIDMTFTEGDLKGQTSLGIYKIEDDVLTICRAAPHNARPSEFSSKPGSGQTLMSYRRENSTPK
jgi:uncharacterized protein (TIGR03067 family)